MKSNHINLTEKISKAFEDGQYQITLKSLYEPVEYMMATGGKRIRPLLVLLSATLFENKIDSFIPLAKAIEIFHNFTLVHDDIMDNAPERRGKVPVFKKWNTNTAILSGDAMMILAYQELEKVETNQSEILSLFNKTAIEVCEGQQLDMNFENKKEITVAQYIDMIAKKTAVLLATSLKVGAIQANAEPKERDLLYDCGYNIGLAFQLKDDLLDAFPRGKDFGKQRGGDITASKKTFLYLKTLQELENKEKADFIKLYHSREINKINNVIQIFERHNVEQHAAALIEDYYKKGITALSEVDALEERKEPLKELINQLHQRTS